MNALFDLALITATVSAWYCFHVGEMVLGFVNVFAGVVAACFKIAYVNRKGKL